MHPHDPSPATGSRSAVNEQFLAATIVTFTAMTLYDDLDARHQDRIVVPFADDADRSHWNFLPKPRPPRHAAARHLPPPADPRPPSGLPPDVCRGLRPLAGQINLEHLLREIDQPRIGHVARDFRDPGGYFLTFFDQPQPDPRGVGDSSAITSR